MSYDVRHLAAAHRFETKVEGYTCELDYSLQGSVMTLTLVCLPKWAAAVLPQSWFAPRSKRRARKVGKSYPRAVMHGYGSSGTRNTRHSAHEACEASWLPESP
jgi:hypothetical protein